MEQAVQKGDVFRMCQVKDAPIKDWVKLAHTRSNLSSDPVIFWLDKDRAHDKQLIAKVNKYMAELVTTEGKEAEWSIKHPVEAINESMGRAKDGKNTISATGNVLRDYLTDLFPIIELGTSAKMLSIVPLLAGGGMFETGAGGSAPKHVQQFIKEGHLRWDSLGEFLAMAVSLDDIGRKTGNVEALVLAETLNDAIEKLMMSGKSPGRTVLTLDNRGSHFYLAFFWAEALSKRSECPALAARFRPAAVQMKSQQGRILGELLAVEGNPVDLQGYYHPDPYVCSQAMRPSATFNSIIDAIHATSCTRAAPLAKVAMDQRAAQKSMRAVLQALQSAGTPGQEDAHPAEALQALCAALGPAASEKLLALGGVLAQSPGDAVREAVDIAADAGLPAQQEGLRPATDSVPVKISYTYTDEAPMLATYSLLPVFRAFCQPSGVEIAQKDISLAGRIKASFPEYLLESQRIKDDLAALGELSKSPAANIIKLPNISASVPQLVAAIKELQEQGFPVPDFPAEPTTKEENSIRERYARVLGSAVNPVLREGNSDRRVAKPVKKFAQRFPHKIGAWSTDSKSHVSHMNDGDFFGNEQSATMTKACDVCIELHHTDGTITVLKPKVSILEGEIIDASLMSVRRLRDFYEESLQDLPEGVLWSLHLKATMMKVSDPVLFGHAVEVFFKDAFTKHAELFKELGINANNGLGDVHKRIAGHPNQAEIEADLKSCYSTRPPMAHVDSSRGITNLHVPSDIIIDASMAAAIRDSGCMWSADDTLADTRFVIPDRSYARIYDVVIKDCKKNGAFDVKTMGAVSNVGLMAAKAEEYGSHDKTFVIPAAGTVKVVTCDNERRVIFSHEADSGDVWRMCQTKDAPIQDWIKLALCRAS